MQLKLPLFLISALLLLTPLTPQSIASPTCDPGNPRSLAYIRRDNNRCEGLVDRNVTTAFSLISFTTTTLSDSYPDTLTILVPGTGRTRPAITIQSFARRYLIDQLASQSTTSGYSFSLNTANLKRADVSPTSLRATAHITRDNSPLYFPVILGQPSDRYYFYIYSPIASTFPTFEIRRRDRSTVQTLVRNPQPLNVNFHAISWDYSNAPAGTYELYIINGDDDRRSFRFYHDPAWF